ncbi:ESX secretion-associated protein EspG [Nocardia uniformis]|uniref:ESX secretion-associated protein EspG n=1 Tax=Nocardia uniformis TaxID=53432 RepID=A0A849C7L8_9NOCA|nr:ESX secretion-associated protein EspG [Nocardia uniformis]NNH71867.1 ESX secretion-associated protein EspG [Nocardia uniformis]
MTVAGTGRTWRFTDLEFVVAWEPQRERTVPRPFVFTSRTDSYDDLLREMNETREHLRDRLGTTFDDVLETVAHPDIRIVVHGNADDDRANPESVIRLLAVRRRDSGYLLRQLPGETVWHGGGYIVTECDALALGPVVVEALPDASPGRAGHIAMPRAGDDQDHYTRRSIAHELTEDRDRERAESFVRAVTTGSGIIEIAQGGSRFGPRGVMVRRLRWRDVADDGRYAITGDDPPIAIGVDVKRLTALVNTEVAEVVQAIKDERV